MKPSWFSPNQQAVMSYLGLRRSVGVIGMALPFVLPLGATAFFQAPLPSSISGYYYTGMRDVFVGSMCAIGVFLLSYKFGWLDNWLGNIAGISAVGLSVFPTTPDVDPLPTGWVRTAGVLHSVFAIVLFSVLAAFCLVLFTRTGPDGMPTKQKKTRNVIYLICGWVIVACLVLGVLAAFGLDRTLTDELRPLFWLESVAVFAFGVAWFVKGETLFRDPHPQRTTGPKRRGADAEGSLSR